MGVTFAYVATSAFILQSMNGLTPICIRSTSRRTQWALRWPPSLAARLAGRVPTRAVITVGLVATVVAGALLLVGALWWGIPLIVAILAFFLLMTAQGLVGPNAGALASAQVPDHPAPAQQSLASSSGAPPAWSHRSPGSVARTTRCRWL